MHTNGVISPPRPYISRLRRRSPAAFCGLYFTPLNANGTSAIMIRALKMMAESMAELGELKCMMLSMPSWG